MKSASYLFSNLNFLAPENAPEWLSVLLGSLDVFTVGALVLLSIGYRVAGRVPGGRAWVGVFGLWITLVAGLVGFTALSSLR
jgi:hypothetical protein